jgi:membrane peptidoglycan carboxypeptidase
MRLKRLVRYALACIVLLGLFLGAIVWHELTLADRCLRTQEGQVVGFEELPNPLVQAILVWNDPEFFTCAGCGDHLSLSVRVVRQCRGARAKNLWGLVQEVTLTWALERRATKKQIFELFVNRAYFGKHETGRKGIADAARFYFGKDVRDLRLSESAVLAMIIDESEKVALNRNPSSLERGRNRLLQRMAEDGRIDSQLAEAASQEPLGILSQ